MTAPAAPDDWQRLDPRILLIDPVKAFRQFVIPAAAAVIGIGTQQPRWLLLATPVIILGLLLAGTVPWLTTWFRIAEGQLVVRRGLLNKRRLTAPLDRIRTVDLEASLLHRLLGLERVQVGTGVDDSRIELDALSSEQAGELRRFLLARSAVADVPPPVEDADGAVASTPTARPRAAAATELARIDYAWLRFAPFSLTRLVIVAATLGALSQFADDLPVFNPETGRAVLDWLGRHSLLLLVPVLLLGFLVAWVCVAVAGYAMQWWDMRLVRERENLHLTRGLFTTNSTTMEEARVRGIELGEPILLRMVSGAELKVLATGLEANLPHVLPPCPTGVATRVGGEILGTTAPLTVGMTAHGPAARRRCHVRNQWATVLVACGLVAALVWLDWPWWSVLALLPVAALGAGAAELEYRHLGHALTHDHLVAGSGGLTRLRTVLERDGVIGWVVSQTWFQRRQGLATLIATTAAGAEKVTISDVPLPVAVAFADRSTPGVLADFLA